MLCNDFIHDFIYILKEPSDLQQNQGMIFLMKPRSLIQIAQDTMILEYFAFYRTSCAQSTTPADFSSSNECKMFI